ncbi:uncharacterized protein LOC116849308 isoform X2 [Odontomachus brunneus]|uniref:uncharacterized protein LOC116849308 isoform X2 n=1 Tax=Odontomachus brunneus TaxID=486640 RepID=UPI0013F1B35E|nr:uncharacterized protein LOC116849308 isoform X2 [Odontomachus brunneus]
MAMNFYPPTSGPQNQLHIQQGTHNTCLSENNSAQLDTSPHLNRFEHIKIIKVEDVLHYFETIPHSFDNNHEVVSQKLNNELTNYNCVNSLIDVIKTCKSNIMNAYDNARYLVHLLRNYPIIIETYLASNPYNYETEKELKELGYYFKVSIINVSNAAQTSSIYSIDQPFVVNPYIQTLKTPRLYGLQECSSHYATVHTVGQDRLFSRLSHRKCTTAHTSGSHQQQLKRIFQ